MKTRTIVFRVGAKVEVAKLLLRLIESKEVTREDLAKGTNFSKILELEEYKAIISKYSIKHPRDRIVKALEKLEKANFSESNLAYP